MSSTPNSLIMGVAAHYTGDMLMPFLKSLRQTSYQGRVCLFVGQMTDEFIAQIRRYAEDVIVLDGEYGQQIARYNLNRCVNLLGWMRRTRRIRRMYPGCFQAVSKIAAAPRRKALQNDLEQRLEGYQSLRYAEYLKYIQNCASDADYILLSDVRDVIFQDDPFKHKFTFELETFQEAEHLCINAEPFNQRWIANLYGQDMLRAIGEQTISCSGTTMGTRNGILRYLQAMTAELARHTRPLGSHDQGVHNYLLYNNGLDPVEIYANGVGPVLTLGGEKELRRDSQGRLLNTDGCVAPVVHQYDRHPNLARELLRRFEA